MPGPGGGKEGQPLPQRKDKSKNGDNSANTANVTHDGIWSAVTTLTPDIIKWDSPQLRAPPYLHPSAYLEEVPEEPPASTYTADTIPTPPETTSELYDSGATRHMTPHKDLLSNFISIAPKPINAANQLTFRAIGRGDLTIHVPNNGQTSNIMLQDVLYAPDIGVTLVSIGLIDKAGYSVTF